MEIHDHTMKINSANELYSSASKDFQRSRQILESLLTTAGNDPTMHEVQSALNVSKANFVACGILVMDSSRKVEFDFSSHNNKTFPTIKFV